MCLLSSDISWNTRVCVCVIQTGKIQRTNIPLSYDHTSVHTYMLISLFHISVSLFQNKVRWKSWQKHVIYLLCIPVSVCGRGYTNINHVFSVKGALFSNNDWFKLICVKCVPKQFYHKTRLMSCALWQEWAFVWNKLAPQYAWKKSLVRQKKTPSRWMFLEVVCCSLRQGLVHCTTGSQFNCSGYSQRETTKSFPLPLFTSPAAKEI